MDVRVGVSSETGALVEFLAAAGDGVHGRVDLEDDGLALPCEQVERRRAKALSAPRGGDAEVFDVEVRARVPEKGEAGEALLVMQYAEMVLFVRHDAALGRLQPLFVLREADGVKRYGGRECWVVKGA